MFDPQLADLSTSIFLLKMSARNAQTPLIHTGVNNNKDWWSYRAHARRLLKVTMSWHTQASLKPWRLCCKKTLLCKRNVVFNNKSVRGWVLIAHKIFEWYEWFKKGREDVEGDPTSSESSFIISMLLPSIHHQNKIITFFAFSNNHKIQ